MALRTVRTWLWVAVVALAAIAGTGAVLLRQQPPAASDGFGVAQFDLVDQNGNPVDETVFVGHPSALFFGFTHCPEVCPTTMAEMSAWFDALGEEGADLRAWFVTVDPQRDTPEVLGDYVGWVSDRITGITGAADQIDRLADAWGVFYERCRSTATTTPWTTQPRSSCSMPRASSRAPSPIGKIWKRHSASYATCSPGPDAIRPAQLSSGRAILI